MLLYVLFHVKDVFVVCIILHQLFLESSHPCESRKANRLAFIQNQSPNYTVRYFS